MSRDYVEFDPSHSYSKELLSQPLDDLGSVQIAEESLLAFENFLTTSMLGRYGDIADHNLRFPSVIYVHNSQVNTQNGIRRVEVMGMIGAGKDCVVDNIARQELPKVHCVEEPARHILKTSKHTRTKIALVPGVRRQLESEIIREKDMGAGETIVFNRGYLDDIPFSRAVHIQGLLPSQIFYQQFLATKVPLPDAVVIMLVRPESGLKRKLTQLGRNETDYSELLNPVFMSILYMQYLRFIQELIDLGQPNMVIVNADYPKQQVTAEVDLVTRDIL